MIYTLTIHLYVQIKKICFNMTSIIIINYKSEELTIKFIQEELTKVQTDYKIVIVNNAATKESDNNLTNALGATLVTDINEIQNNSNIFVISSKENLGFARGNNLAVKFSVKHFNPEYLLFTNNDIKIKDCDVVEKMIAKLKILPDVGILGPNIIGIDGKRQSPEQYQSFLDRYFWIYWCTPFVSKSWKSKRFNFLYKENALEGYHYKVMGSFFICSTDAYLKCGMMDPHTFLYAEETILTERMKNIGKRVYFYPKVTVIHLHGATTTKCIGRKGINYHRIESDTYYYRYYMKTPRWKIIFGSFMYKLQNILKNTIK